MLSYTFNSEMAFKNKVKILHRKIPPYLYSLYHYVILNLVFSSLPDKRLINIYITPRYLSTILFGFFILILW